MTAQLREFARARWAFTVAVLALIGALAVHAVGVGAAPVSETPTTANVQINVTTPTDDLEPGDIVSFNIASSGGVTLSGVEAKLCNIGPPPTLSPAFTSYDTNSYGYSGSEGVRCVRGIPFNGTQGIIEGGLDADATTAGLQAPTYRIDPKVQDPGTTQSPTYDFVVGTGSVQWVNAGGNQRSMECGANKPCAMVVKADHSAGTTYYIQQLVFAGSTVVTTTPTSTPATTTPSPTAATTTSTTTTTTTSTTSTTTTTAPSSTTTSSPATSTSSVPTSTSPPSTTVIVGGVSGTGGVPLAFTGSSTRDLVSLALILLAVGMFALGEAQRRRTQQ